MQKTIRVLRTMEEAEQADREYYASLSPQEKLDLVFELSARAFDVEPTKRLDRVCRVVKREGR